MAIAFNLQELRDKYDCRHWAANFTPLKAKSQNGKELTGPCPVCGGKDRFNVQAKRWLCRNCTRGKWRDIIALAGLVWHLDYRQPEGFQEICRRLGTGEVAELEGQSPISVNLDEEAPPQADWINRAVTVMECCEKALWADTGQVVLTWLRARGLQDETIKRFRLGYNPVSQTIAGHWVYGGLIIPHWDGVTMWCLKVRLSRDGAGTYQRIYHANEAPKYIQVKGSKQNVYNAASLAGRDRAFVVEGELDAILLWQEIGAMAGVITLGSASYHLGDRWLPTLLPVPRFYLSLDQDQAGQHARDMWQKLVGRRGRVASLPGGYKDVTEYYQAGGSLYGWALEQMEIQILFPGE